MKFTDKYIANLKPTATRKLIYEENAHGQGSLGLRIAPTGRKAWVYTYSFAGRVRHMTLGVYPEMSVAQAHAAVGEAMRKRERGFFAIGVNLLACFRVGGRRRREDVAVHVAAGRERGEQ